MKTKKEIECDICKNVLDGSKIYEAGKSEAINDKKLVPLDKVIGEIRKWRRREYGRRNLFQLEKNIRKLGELTK